MSRIGDVHARQILDSRGNPTLEVDVRLDSGTIGRAAIPSGASTGVHEAVELRDAEAAYGGKGVTHAVANVDGELADAVRGLNVDDQEAIDRRMIDLDGTANKGRLGANALLGVSLAVAKAAAADVALPLYRWIGGEEARTLPVPMMNVVNGGAHAQNSLDLQEFMIVPLGADSFAHAMQIGSECFHTLKALLHERGFATSVGDEGGFAPDFGSSEEAIEAVLEAVERAGHSDRVALALDPAATEIWREGAYRFEGQVKAPDEMIAFWAGLIARYPIVSLEDPLAEDEWGAWEQLTSRTGERVQLVGDDLFVTNTERLHDRVQLVGDDLFVTNVDRLGRGIEEGVGNAVLVKVNQIGTLTETLQCIELAKGSAYGVIISHRSGETEDTFIADLAVATGAGQIKTGSASRTDRTAKYNQLLRISEELGDLGHYPGRDLYPL